MNRFRVLLWAGLALFYALRTAQVVMYRPAETMGWWLLEGARVAITIALAAALMHAWARMEYRVRGTEKRLEEIHDMASVEQLEYETMPEMLALGSMLSER